MASSPHRTEHLEPSELGTKAWDASYKSELSNHALDPSLPGTEWFSDSAASEKIVEYLTLTLSLPSSSSFLDLGTGNGHLLFQLREEGGFKEGTMVGVDYSAQSVELARILGQEKDLNVRFERWDIMKDNIAGKEWMIEGGFDVLLDKGTFDAVSLSAEFDDRGRRVCEGYRERVEALVREGGIILVTSCNWTEAELRGWFEGGNLVFMGTISFPSFTFGGKKGQTISSVCFRRKERCD
ncbi:MAG: hypothetical protein M1836_007393 [Candelina mexicana]|nr:MAG: hypothetical protein M1836_007393 [Candelina mexicana]